MLAHRRPRRHDRNRWRSLTRVQDHHCLQRRQGNLRHNWDLLVRKEMVPRARLPHDSYRVAPWRCRWSPCQATSPPQEHRAILQLYGATAYHEIACALARVSKSLVAVSIDNQRDGRAHVRCYQKTKQNSFRKCTSQRSGFPASEAISEERVR